MDTPVHVYVTTKQDFLNAQRLHRKNRPWAAFMYSFWFFVLPAIGLAYLVFFAADWRALLDAHRPSLGALAGVALYVVILLPISRWWQIRKLWNAAQPAKYRGMPVTLQFDEEQIISGRPGESEGRFHWRAIEDYAEDDKLALIYVRRKLFLFIPKRVMDESEWDRLRAIAVTRKSKR